MRPHSKSTEVIRQGLARTGKEQFHTLARLFAYRFLDTEIIQAKRR